MVDGADCGRHFVYRSTGRIHHNYPSRVLSIRKPDNGGKTAYLTNFLLEGGFGKSGMVNHQKPVSILKAPIQEATIIK